MSRRFSNKRLWLALVFICFLSLHDEMSADFTTVYICRLMQEYISSYLFNFRLRKVSVWRSFLNQQQVNVKWTNGIYSGPLYRRSKQKTKDNAIVN